MKKKKAKKRRKVVQFAYHRDSYQEYLTILCDDGTMWEKSCSGWFPVELP